MIYIITLLLSVLLVIPINEKNKKCLLSKILLFLSFCISLLPMGFRYGIGTDYFYTYVPYFKWIGKGTASFDEIGFNLLNKIVYEYNGDYRLLFFITSFIFLFFIYKSIYDNSKNIWMSVALIFLGQSYFYSMNIVRQSIAISILLFSFKYLKENQYIKFLLFVILATSMHITAMFILPFLYLSKRNINRRKKILIIFTMILMYPLISYGIKFLILNTKYSWYYDSVYNTEKMAVTIAFQNIILFILDLYYSKKNSLLNSKVDEEYRILSNINFLAICLILISSTFPLINRVIRYFTIFQLLYIPLLIKKEKNAKLRLLLSMLLLLMMSTVTIYQIFICGGEGVLPYRSIFNVVR